MGPVDFLRKLIGTVTVPIRNAPYNALAAAAKATSGAHPLPASQWRGTPGDPYYTNFRQLPMMPQITSKFAPLGQPQPTYQSPARPQLQLISASYGGLQPSSGGSEDAYQPAQALQNPGYTNQTSLNGQLTQGPMANFYKLIGK